MTYLEFAAIPYLSGHVALDLLLKSGPPSTVTKQTLSLSKFWQWLCGSISAYTRTCQMRVSDLEAMGHCLRRKAFQHSIRTHVDDGILVTVAMYGL